MIKKLVSPIDRRPTLTMILQLAGGLSFLELCQIYQMMDVSPRHLIPEIEDALDAGKIESVDSSSQVIHYRVLDSVDEETLPKVGMDALTQPRSITFLSKVCGLKWVITERILYIMLSQGQVTQDSGKWKLSNEEMVRADRRSMDELGRSILFLLSESEPLTMGRISRISGITRYKTNKILMGLVADKKVKTDSLERWSLA